MKKQLIAGIIAAIMVSNVAFARSTSTYRSQDSYSDGSKYYYESSDTLHDDGRYTSKSTMRDGNGNIVSTSEYESTDSNRGKYRAYEFIPYDELGWDDSRVWTMDEAAEWYGNVLRPESSEHCPSPWTKDPFEQNMIRAANGWKMVYPKPDYTRKDLSHAYDRLKRHR